MVHAAHDQDPRQWDPECVGAGAMKAAAKSMNARIQRIKQMACGYRNRELSRNAIVFHGGGRDRYLRAASAHTTA
jgi:hypothetical protein